jgi:voltage-gated potassium channel Kch
VAEYLGQRAPATYGFLICGAGLFSRLFATELIEQNVTVHLSDTNWEAIRSARMENILCYFGNPMSEHVDRTSDLSIFGTVLVMSPYKPLYPLVTYHFEHEMGKGSVLGLSANENQQRASHQVSESYAAKLCLFNEDISYAKLAGYAATGATIKTTRLSDEFTFDN